MSRQGLIGVIACAAGAWATAAALGGPEFVDVSASANIQYFTAGGAPFSGVSSTFQAVIHATLGHGAAAGDYDNDGDLDLYLLGGLDQPNALLRNDLNLGLKRFTDVTSAAGGFLGDLGLSRVAHFVDLDNDGDLDLLLVNDEDGMQPGSRVFENNGDGTFSDATNGSGFEPFGYAKGGASLADYDGDGLLDVHVSNWGFELNTGVPVWPGRDELYRNVSGLRFASVTDGAGVGFMRDAFTSIFTDFTGDARADLFVAMDHSSDEFLTGDGSAFTQITVAAGTTHTGNDMGAACADFDNDGDLDIYTTNITDREPWCHVGTTQGNVLYVNRMAETGMLTFTNEAAARGVLDTYWGWGVEWVDVENDGDLDLLAVTGFEDFLIAVRGSLPCSLIQTPTVLFVNDGSGHFQRDLAPGLGQGGDSRGLIAFDYDRDGDQDLLITGIDQSVRLLENVSTNQGNTLTVKVTQRDGQNRFGIGVRIDARLSGGVTLRRDILAGESYLVGTPAEAHFGLGGVGLVDALRVHWTDGTMTTLTGVAPGQLLHVVQPACPCERDGVGGVDVFDLLEYLDLWFAGSVAADETGDWVVDVFDLLAYLGCWFDGC